MNKAFKKNEELAQKVMEVLIDDYYHRDKIKSKLRDKEYLGLIEWSILDYESCGFNMDICRIYAGLDLK